MFKTSKKFLCLMLSAILIISSVTIVFSNEEELPEIKNIIYMIPDGGGMAPYYLSDYVKQLGGLKSRYPNATKVEKGEMYTKQYLVGAETTRSANSGVTDSAAGGTALSTGKKTNNYYVGINTKMEPMANILEAAQIVGKNTGMVVTYEWTNATPAAFSSHAEDRYETLNIAEQIVNQGIDVVLGKSISDYTNEPWFTDLSFKNSGYKVVKTKQQLEEVQPGDRIWGKLPASYYDKDKSDTAPSLAELTKAAITALDDDNENGFFLMVEGSAIDGGGHASEAINMVSEFLAFDEACKVAIEYAKGRNDTLVVILPDHDTGGIKTSTSKASADLEDMANAIYNGKAIEDIVWEGDGNHTARDGGVFMYVPSHVNYPDGIDITKAAEVASAFEANTSSCSVNKIDNTEITKYLSGLMGVNLDELTKHLFVDVNFWGEYDEATSTFTLTTSNDKTATIKRNSSVAEIDGEKVELDGQVAVYLNGRFYVPQLLKDILEGKTADGKTPKYIVDKKYYKDPSEMKPEVEDEPVVVDDPSIKGHWAEQELISAVKDGLIVGSDLGLEPDRNVTKAELITMMMRATNNQVDQTVGPMWYSDAGNKALALDWTNEISDMEFDINRAASAGIIANSKKLPAADNNAKEFIDNAEIEATGYLNAVQACVLAGIINGYPDNSFMPLNTITRAEAVVIIRRAFYK